MENTFAELSFGQWLKRRRKAAGLTQEQLALQISCSTSALKKLEADKEYYVNGIEQNKKDMEELMSDPEHLEKYAREHYLMKKDNEEIFLVLPDSTVTAEAESE